MSESLSAKLTTEQILDGPSPAFQLSFATLVKDNPDLSTLTKGLIFSTLTQYHEVGMTLSCVLRGQDGNGVSLYFSGPNVRAVFHFKP